METLDRTGITGSLLIEHRDSSGKLLETREVHNLAVNTGLLWMSGALSGDTATPATMKYIGVGTGTTAVDPTDAALETPVETRATGTQSRVQTTIANDTYQCVGTITATAARAITEAGLFSASTNGTMAARTVFSVINLSTDNTLQITWKISFAAAA